MIVVNVKRNLFEVIVVNVKRNLVCTLFGNSIIYIMCVDILRDDVLQVIIIIIISTHIYLLIC